MISTFSLSFRAKSVAGIYISIALICAVFGTASSGLIRLELLCPELQYWETAYYTMITAHGVVFVFLVLAPVGQAYLNLCLPGLVGVEDFYMPRINLGAALGNALSAIVLFSSWLIKNGPTCGWTFYPPLASNPSNSLDSIIAGLHILGVASLLGSVNTLATIANSIYYINKSADRISLFVWCQGLTAIIFTGSAPGLVIAITCLLLDRSFGFSWFDPAGGGDPVLYQTLFWFFGHPEVYVIILPAFGVINLVFEEGSKISGRSGIMSSLVCLGIVSFIVYGHHMFTVELETEVQLMFTSGTMSIALPTGVKVFAWTFTLRHANLTSPANIAFTCFLVTFLGGGMTGILLSSCIVDLLLHDTEFVVAHFHQVMAIAVVLGFSIGLPSISPNLHKLLNGYYFSIGILSFTIGTLLLFMPMYYAGLQGVPRRMPSYQIELGMDMSLSYSGYLLAEIGIMLIILSV